MKKVIKLATFLVAFSILALGVSAFTANGGGDAEVGDTIRVEITAAEAGALAGMVTVTTSDNIVLVDALSENGSLVAPNLANGNVGIIALSAPATQPVAALLFDVLAEGDYTITIVGADDWDGITRTITGTVGFFEDFCDCGDCAECGYLVNLCPDCGEEVCVCDFGGNTTVDDNAKTGVVLAIVPALVAGAAVAIARKK